MRATEAAPPGLPRLEALAEHFLAYLERWVFPGGCFFSSVMAEAGARDGPVAEAVARIERSTRAYLVRHVRRGIEAGQIREDVDPQQVAFELYAFLELANYQFVLFREPPVLQRSRRAIRDLVDRIRPRAG